jgi:hypothetical protein
VPRHLSIYLEKLNQEIALLTLEWMDADGFDDAVDGGCVGLEALIERG